MEPQGRKNISPLPATKRIGRQRKTTRRSRVHAQSVGLNAERKICRHRAEGEIFLLTFPYIGRQRKTTRRSRVHAQSVGLNAERTICRHRAEGEIFLVTFPYIGLLQANS